MKQSKDSRQPETLTPDEARKFLAIVLRAQSEKGGALPWLVGYLAGWLPSDEGDAAIAASAKSAIARALRR
jgi:hypothetical protein